MNMRSIDTRMLAGIQVPATYIVDRAIEYARQKCEPYLFSHVVRSWLFAARIGQLQNIEHDAEVVAVGTLLHDITLNNAFVGPRRFIPSGEMKKIVDEFPRLGMKSRMTRCFCCIARSPGRLSIIRPSFRQPCSSQTVRERGRSSLLTTRSRFWIKRTRRSKTCGPIAIALDCRVSSRRSGSSAQSSNTYCTSPLHAPAQVSGT
jgi:hypothetical protein